MVSSTVLHVRTSIVAFSRLIRIPTRSHNWMPIFFQNILKYDLINDVTSFVGQEAEEVLRCNGNGVVGTDGCIYALEDYSEYPRVLNIDKTNNYHGFV